MRLAFGLVGVLIATGAWGQPTLPTNPANLPTTTPDAIIVVRDSTGGADLVEVSMVKAGYPKDLLRAQCQRLVQEAGGDLRGLQIFERRMRQEDPQSAFVKAYFGTTNLYDPVAGSLNLQPIVRAFTGTAAPYTIDALIVSFSGHRATERNLNLYRSDAVEVVGNALTAPAGLEYRITLKTQDPAKIEIPDRYTPPPPKPVEKAAESNSAALRILLIVGGSLLAGALVYFLVARLGR